MAMPLERIEDVRQPRREAPVLRLVRPPSSPLPSHQRRTCARCGDRAWFQLEDAAGCWYRCTACGAYA
jgi:radical SAM superfamily enzyme YgiQ (UPF0313 family)